MRDQDMKRKQVTSDATYVKVPKRDVPLDVSSVPFFTPDRLMSLQPEQSISTLEKGYEISAYHPFIRNISENVEELIDYSSPLDDIYEAKGGKDKVLNTALDMIGPAELAKIGLAGAKGAAVVVPLLKAPSDDVVRLYHGSRTPINKFTDPLLTKPAYHTMRGPGFYTTSSPSLSRTYTDPKTGVSEIYTIDIPEDEFGASIYRPTLAKTETRLTNSGVSTSTPERKELQDFLSQFMRNQVETNDYRSVYPYTAFGENKDIAKDLAYATFLRDAGYIGHGPYKDVSANKEVYNLLTAPSPSYKIQLEPSDYDMSPSEFDEYIESLLPKSVNVKKYK